MYFITEMDQAFNNQLGHSFFVALYSTILSSLRSIAHVHSLCPIVRPRCDFMHIFAIAVSCKAKASQTKLFRDAIILGCQHKAEKLNVEQE